MELCDYKVLDEQFGYKKELGAIYTPNETSFLIWAPTASEVSLIIYNGYYGEVDRVIPMTRLEENRAVFTMTLEGDCDGLTYQYELVFADGTITLTGDPYARAATVNGHRSVVVNLNKTNPVDWDSDRCTRDIPSNKTVIYEMHVRDFSISPTSGIQHKGKFLGVVEPNTHNRDGSPTGLSYLQQLGVTHVEILPMFDYATVDKSDPAPFTYNWGYDPYNYNVPEGSYSTNAYNPYTRIIELKKMIQGLHKAGIKVIMDVVYNHVYQVESHSFNKVVPGYYFRQNDDGSLSNGTGVGNDTASERLMMRQYIIDSVTYWAKEYHIDGFRFDLMGIHDIETMNAVRHALDDINPDIMMLGEGWDLNTPLPSKEKANHYHMNLMPRIAQFNDKLREALKGNDFESTARGFINGAWYMENLLANQLMGSIHNTSALVPQQLIQYVEAHDNYTLYDRLCAADPNLDDEVIVKRQELATTAILLAQGIPFLHAGQEFMRTKYGIRDSYNKPDPINQIDWNRQDKYRSSVNYVEQLIQLRESEPLFTLTNYDDIQHRIQVVRADYQIVHLLYSDSDYQLIVILNGQGNTLRVPLEKGHYILKVKDRMVYLDDNHYLNEGDFVSIPPYEVLILKKV